jgi:signal transduction histidine kinase/CheY-like chemotaxis protein
MNDFAMTPGIVPQIDANSESIDNKVKLTLLQLLFRQLPQGLAATVLNASLLTYIMSSVVPGPTPKLWLTAMVVVCLARAASTFNFNRYGQFTTDYARWRNSFAAGAILTGALWGLSGVVLFPTSSYQHQAFIGFILAGMAAGAAGSMSAHDKIFRTYLFLTVAPYMIRLIIEGSSVNLAMAAMCAAFIAAVGMSAKRNTEATRDALRLQFVNDELAQDLERTLARYQSVNNALQIEVGKHQRTMESLEVAVQDAKASVTTKSRFLANMSHEIRTPMNGVFGMTDLLMRTPLDARQKKLVGTINESAKSLLTIINDILDFSRIESGKLELDKHEFNMHDLVERSVELFAGQCQKNGVEISLFIDRDVPLYAIGDSGRVKQIILNLIGNAIKFTKYGEIAVRITAAAQSEETSHVSIEIKDTGIGIDRVVLDKLFQPFTQAETNISRRFGGTGLGLAIARHLAEMMGGTIKLDSELGKGTTATIALPLTHGERNLDAIATDPSVLDGARVLVIDDRETNRDIVANYLEGSSAIVSLAESAAVAWPMLVAAEAVGKPFHAAVVDMVMPDENGIAFAQRVKAHPTLSKLRIIIATSINWQGDVAAIREAGIEAVLTKPMRRDDLVDAAARAVTGTRHPGWRAGTAEQTQPKPSEGRADGIRKPIKANILLAEDNPVNVEVAKEYLSWFGCNVHVANNGLEAVAALKSTPYDLVFMDCQMPVMDGLTATRRIRSLEKDEGLPRVPVIALTANAFAEDRARCLDAGMDDYLSKPYSEDQLYGMLEMWLANRTSKAVKRAVVDSTDLVTETIDPIDFDEPVETEAEQPKPQVADIAVAAIAPPVTAGLLDEAVLAPMRSKRPELLVRIVNAYLAFAPTAIADLAAAAKDGDLERLGRQAHSLKSSSANLGAMSLSALCRDLEQLTKSKDADACRPLAAKVCATFAEVHKALEAEMATLMPAVEAKKAVS